MYREQLLRGSCARSNVFKVLDITISGHECSGNRFFLVEASLLEMSTLHRYIYCIPLNAVSARSQSHIKRTCEVRIKCYQILSKQVAA